MGLSAYQAHAGNADKDGQAEPTRGRTTNKEFPVSIVSYWQSFIAPYIQARFGKDERGASLVEYALLVALIAVVCIIAITALGQSASDKFSEVGSKIAGA